MTSQRRVAVTSKATDSESLAALLSAAAVRQRCRWFLEAARAGTLKHFVYDDSMLDDCVQIVAQETRTNYPDLVVPYHSRWRHFETPTGDLSNVLLKYVGASDHDRCRAELDLVFVSVLLDAGAGGRWQYRDDDTGMVYRRSEGLAVASIRMFVAGLFSSVLKPLSRPSTSSAIKASESTWQGDAGSDENNPATNILMLATASPSERW